MMYDKNKCDCVISIDADLQDDVDAFSTFIEKYKLGCQVVYGVRSERKKDSWFDVVLINYVFSKYLVFKKK